MGCEGGVPRGVNVTAVTYVTAHRGHDEAGGLVVRRHSVEAQIAVGDVELQVARL